MEHNENCRLARLITGRFSRLLSTSRKVPGLFSLHPIKLAVAALLILAAQINAAEKTVGLRIAEAARQQIGVTLEYDPGYTKLDYPAGDVPRHKGVCSDVVVRALRAVGVDLQKEVHEDMRRNFKTYPQRWGLTGPDKNIDHRRVPNLMRYFERHHTWLAEKTTKPYAATYAPGDIVAWDLGGGVKHIGIVSERKARGTPLIIHNIGRGAQEEDILFKCEVIGHYRLKSAGTVGNGPSVGIGRSRT